ncbi:MAG: glycosyltransferase [Candidatus Peribacteraceae bacterium]|nr:glycosyltransferase [Candidatus Peribacteraceae bacterium]
MKLLLVTQKADRNDYILGFFHRWMEEFAKHVDQLTIVAQATGDYSLPQNVQVLSLGKEQGRSRLSQILQFWRLLFRLRDSYDCVLVHMTPIWVLLGWPLWFLLRKPVFLWYEIRRGSSRLSLALLCVRKVFSATARGLPYSHHKQVVLGHGINTAVFTPAPDRREEALVAAVGRITRSKRYDVILRAFAGLPEVCRLCIAGGTVTAADQEEKTSLDQLARELGIARRVEVSWVEPEHIPALLRRASLVLHACVGGLDKVVLEAMACGTPVVSTSEAAKDILPRVCLARPDTLADHARRILSLSSDERAVLARDLRQRVVDGHALPRLIERLVQEMQ